MSENNIVTYARVLGHIEDIGAPSPDRYVTLTDIETAFVAKTDKSNPKIIQKHIDYMCKLRLLVKKGELTYILPENWKAIATALGATP